MRSRTSCLSRVVSHIWSPCSYCLSPSRWSASSWKKKALYYPAISCRSSYTLTSPEVNNKVNLLWKQTAFPSVGKKWRMFGSHGRKEKKERTADCFSPLSSCHIELVMDHHSDAPTGVFSFLFFQLDVIVSNNMNLNGWWESCNNKLQ